MIWVPTFRKYGENSAHSIIFLMLNFNWAIIRKALDDYDFGLDDNFCDAYDLKTYLSNVPIPEPILNLFDQVFNFNPKTYDNAVNSMMADNFLGLISEILHCLSNVAERYNPFFR